MLLSAAARNGLSMHKVPSWLKGWKSPWREKVNGGELIPEGEQELYDLGIRTRKLFPDLLSDDYHPDIYTIKATQVISAFGIVCVVGCAPLIFNCADWKDIDLEFCLFALKTNCLIMFVPPQLIRFLGHQLVLWHLVWGYSVGEEALD